MLTERHIRSIRTLLKAPRGRITSNPTGSSIVANNPAIMPALPATTPGEGQLAPPPPPEPERQAAVLIPLCIDKGEPSMLFTRRTRRMRRNTGEISFPGGRIDKGEESTPWVTALRETEEEIGIPRSRIEMLGSHHDAATAERHTERRTIVTPAVGLIHGDISEMPLKMSLQELDLIFTVPLRHLCQLDLWTTKFNRPALFFQVGSELRLPTLRSNGEGHSMSSAAHGTPHTPSTFPDLYDRSNMDSFEPWFVTLEDADEDGYVDAYKGGVWGQVDRSLRPRKVNASEQDRHLKHAEKRIPRVVEGETVPKGNPSSESALSDRPSRTIIYDNHNDEGKVLIWGVTAWMAHTFLKQVLIPGYAIP